MSFSVKGVRVHTNPWCIDKIERTEHLHNAMAVLIYKYTLPKKVIRLEPPHQSKKFKYVTYSRNVTYPAYETKRKYKPHFRKNT